MAREYLTLTELSEYLSRPKQTIYYWVCRKLIPYYKPTGKNLYFSKTEIDEWIRTKRVKSDEELEKIVTDKIVSQR